LLKYFFKNNGQIKKVKIIRTSTYESKGFGYIEFYNENDASQVFINIDREKLILYGKKMMILPFSPKPKFSKKTKNQPDSEKLMKSRKSIIINLILMICLLTFFSKYFLDST
jgi:RNA recognition motif-containing protein